MLSIDLNCDMGESFGAWSIGQDAALMQFISSANIACGYHAGDPQTMRSTVRLALKHHVAIGAHPGFPDLQGFGRRNMQCNPEEVYAFTLYQIGALKAITEAEGGTLHHVKPHGALYNMAAKDNELAEAIAKATLHAGSNLVLYGLSGSALIKVGNAIGLRTAQEGFADRGYQTDGSLTPRTHAGALINSVEKVVEQALKLAKKQPVASVSGELVQVTADTICLHGDGVHALGFAEAIHQSFKLNQIQIQQI
ncbi:MAG: LamB/YcsF family protein [Saprospiraceae bacterium]|nr:LamB/YcsF family protein [Saprospiraceae bacterium]